jgi:acetyl esterase/lipase
MIGGDSAGGSLTVQMLRHIVDPRPCVEPFGNWPNDEALAAAFIVSAPFSGGTDTVSYRENTLDMLSGPLINMLTANFLIPENVTPPLTMEEIRGLAFPLESDLSWLGSIHKAVRAIYLTAGDEEVFRDHICEFVEALQARSKSVDVKFDLFSKHIHDSHLIEGFFGTGPAITAMTAWAKDIF